MPVDSAAVGRAVAHGAADAQAVSRTPGGDPGPGAVLTETFRGAGSQGAASIFDVAAGTGPGGAEASATPLADIPGALSMQAGDVAGAAAEIGKAQGALATTGAVFGALTAVEQLVSAPLSAIPFPAFPAARILDMALGLPHGHSHPPTFGAPLPSTGPVIPIPYVSGASTVLINGMPAGRCGDMGVGVWCGGYFPMYELFLGSSSVWIEGARASRLGVDITKHCVFSTPKPSDPPVGPMIGALVTGSPNVVIGGVPMPSLTSLAVGAAFKVVSAGLGRLARAVKSASRFSRLRIVGRAQAPRLKWAKNPGGQVRTMAEAVEIARRNGVHIPDDIRFVARPSDEIAENALAEYSMLGGNRGRDFVEWEGFYNRFDQIPVRVSDKILDSDEAIVAVLGHEMHELNGLRKLFDENGGRMPAAGVQRAIEPGRPGNLHDQAWDVADELVEKMRGQ